LLLTVLPNVELPPICNVPEPEIPVPFAYRYPLVISIPLEAVNLTEVVTCVPSSNKFVEASIVLASDHLVTLLAVPVIAVGTPDPLPLRTPVNTELLIVSAFDAYNIPPLAKVLICLPSTVSAFKFVTRVVEDILNGDWPVIWLTVIGLANVELPPICNVPEPDILVAFTATKLEVPLAQNPVDELIAPAALILPEDVNVLPEKTLLLTIAGKDIIQDLFLLKS